VIHFQYYTILSKKYAFFFLKDAIVFEKSMASFLKKYGISFLPDGTYCKNMIPAYSFFSINWLSIGYQLQSVLTD